jgi:hypothetical protein
MSGSAKLECNLVWKELLNPEEIRAWVKEHSKPVRLDKEFDRPGVYRFVFNEASDQNGSSHTPCYVGETLRLCRRLPKYFREPREIELWFTDVGARLPSGWKLPESWRVRDRVRNSSGEFKLQLLDFQDDVVFPGFRFEMDSIEDKFESSFTRRMLENWAILYSIEVDKLTILNHRESVMKKKVQAIMRRSASA